MQEKLTFHNSKGDKLIGVLSNPIDKTDKIVLICHGLYSNKERPTYVELQDILNEKGLATFRFDFYGQGESEGNLPDITVTELVDEVLKAVEFLRDKGYSSFGFFGGSFAGEVLLVAIPKIKDVFCLTLRCPVIDYHKLALEKYGEEGLDDWKEKGFRLMKWSDGNTTKLNYSLIEDVKKYDGFEYCKKINVPTIIVHGDKDEAAPHEHSIKASKLIPNCRLEIIKGADHHFTGPGQQEKSLKFITEFIAKHS